VSFRSKVRTTLALLAVVTFLAACSDDKTVTSATTAKAGAKQIDASLEPLRVGLLFSLTGAAAPFGISERDGAKVVLDKANAEGGINGRKIEMFEADDATDPTQAAREAKNLIDNKKIHVLIGATIGGNTLALAPIAAAAKIPILATNGTISVTSKANAFWPQIFRAAPSDLVTAKSMLERAVKEGSTKIAIFAQEDAYGNDTLKLLQDEIAKNPALKLVETARSPSTATDLTAQATRLRNANPDTVLMIVSPPTLGGALVRAIKQVGLTAKLWGPIGLSQAGFIKAGGDAAEGVRTVAMVDWVNPDAGEQQLATLLKAAGVTPSAFEVAGANGAQAITAAVAKVSSKTITSADVQTQLESLCPFDTYARGKDVCYSKDDRDGYKTDALVTLVVKGGAFAAFTG
jgi:branched-chain amino acid transport system substrate-binding protein